MATSKGSTDVKNANLTRPQIKCHHLKVFVCLSTVASFLWMSNAEMVCTKGFENFAGATYPPGDIAMQEGDTLDVYCSVNLTHPKARGYNASDLQFLVKKHEIPENLIRKEIINETTIRLRVDKMNESVVYLDCLIEKKDGETVQVCQKHVEVGHEPKELQDFRCKAPGWAKLVCTWRRPYNPVTTKYSVTYTRVISSMQLPEPCPEISNYSNGSSSCEWNRHNSNYRPNEKIFNIRVVGTNALNKTGVVWNYSINHFSVVIPDAPTIESLTVLSWNKLRVNYTFKYYEHFRPGLEHSITVCTESGDCNETILSTVASTTHFVVREEEVPYAYTNYTVSVRLRSGSAERSDEFWSPQVSATARTLAKAPDSPPKTNIGSFMVYRKTSHSRDIYVYWEQIPPLEVSGPNFQYEVILNENGIETYVHPDEKNISFAKFVNLSENASYNVDIYAVNDLGRSKEKSTVMIPNSQKAPKEPQLVSKLDYGNGTYVVTWTPPSNKENIITYTVFRCNQRHPRPHECNGLLKWDEVLSVNSTRIVYENLPHEYGDIYQFAVSANTEHMSSGMVWASCTLLPNRIPERLKTVRPVNTTEDQIRIEWDLDCSYQDGVIEGFRIIYCQVDADDPSKCGEERSAITMKNTTYTLRNLQPFSKYKIGVSIQTKDGESQQSHPIYATTAQGAPSDPPLLQLKDVRNTSISLSITPPKTRNGIIKSYKIWIFPVTIEQDFENSTKRFKTIDVLPHQSAEQSIQEKLVGLVSNTNYSIQCAACTVKCSDKSDPIYVVTKIGVTHLRSAPSLSYGSGDFKITWKNPSYLGGPVSRYEIMVQQNGEVVNTTHVKYNEDISEYVNELKMDCDSNTNLTAKIRAITTLENGEQLYGDWSQEGYVACIGGAGWVTWVTIILISLFIIVLFGIAGHRLWNYYKECSDFDPKLPPGLEKELYPCNHTPSNKKSSNGAQSFSKGSLFQLKYTPSNNIKQGEDRGVVPVTKNSKKRSFSEKTLADDGKNVVPVGLEAFGGTTCQEVKHEHESNETPWLWQVAGPGEPMINRVSNQNPHEISTHLDQFNNIEDCMVENRRSPSALNPLLPDRVVVTDDEDYFQTVSDNSQIPGQPYKKLGMLTNENAVVEESIKLNSSLESIRSGVPVSPLRNDYANQKIGAEDELSSAASSTSSSLSPSSPEKVPAASRLVPDVLTNNASYVKWTQLLPEFKSDAISSRQSSPYCQVGII